ncbi:MAG: GMC family oxidoreductase [Lautropia sp.]|nr:GMC family oxidoreductase [Lautropia sp.]
MLINTNEIASGSVIDTDICIIGGGAAGITMGLAFEKAGVDCVILESGGFSRDEATADLYRGSSVGIPYDFADGTRSRFLGGSSNCWGGFCRPWDQSAFDHRSWVNASGWPIGREELEPFYMRSHEILNVSAQEYRAEQWVGMGDEPAEGVGKDYPVKATRFPVDHEKVEEIISQFSPPLKLGEAYRQDLKDARHVSVYLKANVVDIQCNPWGGAVESVRVRTLKGVSATVRARTFILAAGGIENARLLLASNRQHSGGLGNRYDLVGRYFQDHPRFLNGEVEFTEPYQNNPLFDIKFHCIVDDLIIGDTKISGQLRLPYAVQKQHGLLDAQVWFRSLYAGEGTDVVRALYRMRQRVRGKWSPRIGLGSDLGIILSHPLDSASYVVAHSTSSRRMVRSVTMEMIAEPEPDYNSRVMLGDDIDALGMRRAKIDWRLTQRVRDTVDTTFELIARELEDKNIARVKLGSRVNDTGWPSDLEGTYHHMGTTRMHDSPRHGVVDRNCQVHGIANLYIAGSSVFPTSSSNHPTMTLVALALRLSDRLVAERHKVSSHVESLSDSSRLHEPVSEVSTAEAA